MIIAAWIILVVALGTGILFKARFVWEYLKLWTITKTARCEVCGRFMLKGVAVGRYTVCDASRCLATADQRFERDIEARFSEEGQITRGKD